MNWAIAGLAGFLLLGGTVLRAGIGDNCSAPIRVDLPAALPYVDANTTCGRGDDYRDTCLAAYDDGEDIVYQLVLTRNMNLRLSVSGAAAAGIVIDTACPPGPQCLSLEVDPGGLPPRLDVELTAGTYYVMVDTRPPPSCSAFTLTIEELAPLQPGDSCTLPRVLHLPADLPFSDVAQHTCGRYDFYSDYESCLGPFTGGQEMIYDLVVTTEVDVEVTLDPRGRGWTALALDDTCPPTGASCLAFSASDLEQPHGLPCLPLRPGRYTLMVDCYPTAALGDCIPSFDLAIRACSLPRGACCVGGACIGTLAQPTCLALGGRWYEGFACSSLPCPTLLGALPEGCATAHPLPPAPCAVELYTSVALPGGPAGSCNVPGTHLMQNDVWFTHTPAVDGQLTIEVRYDYDGLTAIYSGPDCQHLTELYCLNSGSSARPDADAITFSATGGTTYWFQVGDVGLNPGGGWTLVVLVAEATVRPGDVNCDGRVDFGDINPFVVILANPTEWKATYPHCPFLNGDINNDGRVDFGDINPFVDLLTHP